jgi:hypothetical protein
MNYWNAKEVRQSRAIQVRTLAGLSLSILLATLLGSALAATLGLGFATELTSSALIGGTLAWLCLGLVERLARRQVARQT